MIESLLGFLPANGEPLPLPTLEKLKREYFPGARLTALFGDVLEPQSDAGRVITIKPEVVSKLVSSIDYRPLKRKGYFAYGELGDGLIDFSIFAPHLSVKGTFPPKSLENGIGLFMIELVSQGYSLPPSAVTYATSITR